MERNGKNQNSALSAIARHERELLAKREETEREAERIVAEARTEARRIIDSEGERLANDAAAIRREGDAARERERLEQERQADERLARLRADAQTRAQAVVGAVVSLILPSSTGGSR